FAWFTDSVTSNNNKIVAGNLDVELYYQVENQTDWTKVGTDTNVFKANTLWEPGHTEVVRLKVVNEGSLALKYQLGVNIASETTSTNVYDQELKLSNFIEYGLVEGANNYTTREEAITAVKDVKTALNVAYNSGTTKLTVDDTATTDVKENEDFVTMVVYMPTTVGNDANAKKGAVAPEINLGINLYATQVEAEDDSFGGDYDEDAIHEKFEVTTANDLQAAINNGKTNIVLAKDIVTDETIVIPAPKAATVATMSKKAVAETTGAIVIDLNGKTLKAADKNVIRNDGAPAVLKNGTVERTGTVAGYAVNIAKGELTVETVTIKGGLYCSGDSLDLNNANISQTHASRHVVYAWDCEVTINSGTYYNYNAGNATIMAAGTSVVTIVDGTFGIADGRPRPTESWTSCLLDTESGAKFILNGGTFNGGFRVKANTSMVINGGSFNDIYGSNYYIFGTVSVYGGQFTDATAKAFAEKYVVDSSNAYVDDNGNFIVADKEEGEAFVNALVNGESVTLTKDINLAGIEIPVIENYRGTIDGKGFKIYNLTSTTGGLFRKAIGVTIKNVDFVNVDVTNSTGNWAGALVGRIDKDASNPNDVSVIENVTVSGKVNYDAYYVGGLVGADSGYNTTFKNCVNRATVTGKNQVGGIVGYATRGTVIDNCENYGAVTATNVIAGGIVGLIAGDDEGTADYSVVIKNSKNYANVSSVQFAGGIAGRFGRDGGNGVHKLITAYIENCSYTGTVTVQKPSGENVFANELYGEISNYCDGKPDGLLLYVNGEAVNPVGEEVVEGIYKIADRTFNIYTETGLKNFGAYVKTLATGEGIEAKFNLMTDVDLSGDVWAPIEAMWVHFYGNNHTISNLNCGRESYVGRSGFWSYAGACRMYDLTLENVTSCGTQVGTFAGSAEGLLLSNCTLKGNNTVTWEQNPAGSAYFETWNGVGALTGVMSNSTVENVTIAEGATVTLNYNQMTSAAP
ncbi:MAG: hypothetical protein IJB97_05925, partial [Clostridia bacterium]|nr:hypothetical protein [Clostridia bacterium]